MRSCVNLTQPLGTICSPSQVHPSRVPGFREPSIPGSQRARQRLGAGGRWDQRSQSPFCAARRERRPPETSPWLGSIKRRWSTRPSFTFWLRWGFLEKKRSPALTCWRATVGREIVHIRLWNSRYTVSWVVPPFSGGEPPPSRRQTALRGLLTRPRPLCQQRDVLTRDPALRPTTRSS